MSPFFPRDQETEVRGIRIRQWLTRSSGDIIHESFQYYSVSLPLLYLPQYLQ
jgi:hypothetical protein